MHPPHGLVKYAQTAMMFEVLWNGKSVGCYNTEQEAENMQKIMHWEVQYPEPKEPKPRPFDFYDVITCLGFAYAYTIAILSMRLFLVLIVELVWATFAYMRYRQR